MDKERITRAEIEVYKREVLEKSVLVTVPNAAEVLSCSSSTVHRLIREGRLSAYNGNGRMSKGTRLLASELREYVSSIKIDRNTWNE